MIPKGLVEVSFNSWRIAMGQKKFIASIWFTIFMAYAGSSLAGERFIAYQVPEGLVGNQDILGTTSIGMDFDVNLDITVTRLGVFDSGANGLSLTLTATLYDRDTALPVVVLLFSP